MKYRRGTTNDMPGILKLSRLLNEDDETKSPKDLELQVRQALENSLIWVAEEKERIIGYILCELFGQEHKIFPNSVFISDLYVDADYRKQGIGRRLISEVIASTFPAEYKYFSITHDPKEKFLTKFYESCGFIRDGRTKVDNIKLIKEI